MVTIRIPTPLRAYTNGLKVIEIEGDTVASALESLCTQYPGVKPHLFDDQGIIRSYVNLFVNDEDIRTLKGQDTPISPGDRLMIIPSIAGGMGRSSRDLGTNPRSSRMRQ
ncbi:MAG: MoaD/ThiS family protein [Anaerolineales bacterium]|nr:MAG: MoaD/ThiS family protein [Anaerolineales bacterium]